MADSRIFSKALRPSLNADGDLVIPVIGVPFGGPQELGGRDYHGEYFDATTDTGPLMEVLSYFDHGFDQHFGGDLIGKAYRKSMDPDTGWIYDIVVSRRHRYFEALQKLAEENLLAASSSAYPYTTERTEYGKIKRWHVIEVSLTPEPANPLAVQTAKSLVSKQKELGMPEETGIAPTPTSEPVSGTGEELVKSIAKAVEDVMADAPEPVEAEAVVLEPVFDIAGAFAQLNARLDALEADVKSVKSLQSGVEDIKTALPALAAQIAASVSYKVGSKVRDEARKSEPEKVAEAVIETKAASRIPSLTATFGRKGA